MQAEKCILLTLILNRLTSRMLKLTLILAKALTSDPYNGGLLKRRLSVPVITCAENVTPTKKTFGGP